MFVRFLYSCRGLYSHLYGPVWQVLHPTCPKLLKFRNVEQVKSHIQAVRYQIFPLSRRLIFFFTYTRTRLSAITTKPVFWYLQIFSLVYYDWILSIGQHVNIADLGVRLRLLTFFIIFPTLLRTGISPDFTWIFIDWVSAGFFPGVFLLDLRKKDTGKKLSQKSESIYSFKNKCNFWNHDNSFRKIKWFV